MAEQMRRLRSFCLQAVKKANTQLFIDADAAYNSILNHIQELGNFESTRRVALLLQKFGFHVKFLELKATLVCTGNFQLDIQ